MGRWSATKSITRSELGTRRDPLEPRAGRAARSAHGRLRELPRRRDYQVRWDGGAQRRVLRDRNWARGVILWNLALDEQHGPHTGGCGNCRGVVTIKSDGTVERNEEYYEIGTGHAA